MYEKGLWIVEEAEKAADDLDILIKDDRDELVGWFYNVNDAVRTIQCVNACTDIPQSILEDREYSIKAELDSLDEQIQKRIKAEERVKELESILANNKHSCYTTKVKPTERAKTDRGKHLYGLR